jgi:hypothetical protein
MGTLKPGATYVYESPDNGKTIYAREQGAPHSERFVIGYTPDLFTGINWQEIVLHARTNSVLRKVLERAILIHHVSKDYGQDRT